MTNKIDSGICTHLTALLGLAANKNTTTDACPSDQQIADFIQGHMKIKIQQRVQAHLNNCSDCREAWLNTTAYMDTVEFDPAAESAKTNRFSWFPTFNNPFANRLNSWHLATASMATAAILVTLLWPTIDTLDQRINASYDALAMTQNPTFTEAARTFPMPRDIAVMGFSQTLSEPKARAFGAGLWAGKNALLSTSTTASLSASLAPPDKPWQSGQWAEFYQMGRWLFLLWVETQTPAEETDWPQHAEILQQWVTQSEGGITDSLQAIDTKLQSLMESQNPAREQNQLRRLLEMTIQQYATD